MRKSLWSPDEDEKLRRYVAKHGCGNWSEVAKHTGLQRCGKSCRLRWINYLRPDLRRGPFSAEEIRLVVTLHNSLGNSWSKIATYVQGRTDNDIKNFWHSYTRSTRMQQQQQQQQNSAPPRGKLHEQPVITSSICSPGTMTSDKKCEERITTLGISASDEMLPKENSSSALLCEIPFVAQEARSYNTHTEFDGTDYGLQDEVQMKHIADHFLYSTVPVACGVLQDDKSTMAPLEFNYPCLLPPDDEEVPEGLQSVIWNFVNRQLPSTEVPASCKWRDGTASSEGLIPCAMTTPQLVDEFWRSHHKSLTDMQADFLPDFRLC